MARNGSGTMILATGNPVVSSSTISSTVMNNTLSDLASALTQSVSQDGQTPITANLPMSGFKHTGVANSSSRTEYCSTGQAQDNTFDWLTTVAGTDTITASVIPSIIAYTAGQTFRFIATGANTTTTVTININALGAKAITKKGSTALAISDIAIGSIVEIIYDGTQFQAIGLVYASSGANNDITSLTALASVPTVVNTAIVASFPAGTIIDFGGASAPTGYVLCDGSSYLRAGTYASLYAAIGVLWGSADGTHFNVPNFAAGEAAVQTAGTVGASTVGALLTHSHMTNAGVVAGGGGGVAAGSTIGYGNAIASTMTPLGGTKNQAAGQYVLKCIKY